MPDDAPIDLRSDTVTKPTAAMREAMMAAEVGDDQFGEDPTMNELQDRAAELLGKEAALWMPSGTMANQVALRTLTRPGDDVLVAREAHSVWHETGGSAANSGVQLTEIGRGGVFTAADVEANLKPQGHFLFPPTTLVEVENTHNRAGGVVFPQGDLVRIGELCRAGNVATYLDGARLWNASVATETPMDELAAPVDVVMVALSKGLGCPGGSILAGSEAFVDKARRYRRMMGGAMRQLGFYAAAGLHAIDHHVDRLADDHANARRIAEAIADHPNVDLDLATVQTNIVVFRLPEPAPDAATVVERARERGVLVVAFGPRTVRATTHLDVDRAQCERAGKVLAEVVEG